MATVTFPSYPPKFVGETAKTISGQFLAIKSEWGNIIWKLAVPTSPLRAAASAAVAAAKTGAAKTPYQTAVEKVAVPTRVITTRPAAEQTVGGLPMNVVLIGAAFVLAFVLLNR